MRILAGGRVLPIGQHQCPEFDCPLEPLPGKLKVLLCLVDGAERRRQIQAKLNVLHPRADEEKSLERIPCGIVVVAGGAGRPA
jgi:hypothetical protein